MYKRQVEDHPHIMFHRNFGRWINKLTYAIADFGLTKSAIYSQKWLSHIKRKTTTKKVAEALARNKVVYTISPSLFSRPDYWRGNIKVLGFHERNKSLNWNPSIALENFIKKHTKFVVVTFGSMINDSPLRNTEMILQILENNKIPAIINTCAGGLVIPKNYANAQIHFVDTIPYDWIFPKAYAVIHHGGSGTTHMALKYGCANLIIPHIVDQYVWNIIVHEKGVGPLGIDISSITVDTLAPKIIDLIENKTYKTQAEQLGLAIQKENFETKICDAITA